jgi:hypothetical protein
MIPSHHTRIPATLEIRPGDAGAAEKPLPLGKRNAQPADARPDDKETDRPHRRDPILDLQLAGDTTGGVRGRSK